MGSIHVVRAAVLTLLLVLAPAAARACSPVAGYVRPSNFELVQIADAIVVATPIGESGKDFEGKVRFRVDQVLKGQAGGQVEVSRFRLGRTLPSDPNTIAFSHPEGHAGPCNRMTLSKKASYILFLGKTDDGYGQLGFPFSRVSEDYAGEDALWIRTIRTYLRIQNSSAPMARLAELDALRATIEANPARTRDDVALAQDIAGHLGSISPWKPTEFLMEAYADHAAGRPPRYAPRSAAFDEEQSEVQAMSGAMMDLLGVEPPAARPDPVKDRLITALIEGDHPDAMPLFAPFARSDAPPAELALAIRFLAKNGRLGEAYRLIETRAAPLMATAPREDAFTLAWAMSEALQDPAYGQGRPRWREDAEVAARWPKLAFELTLLSQRRFGEGLPFKESLKSLLTSDFRANPDLTLALSGEDSSITDWADRELARPENFAASGGDAPLLLPLRIRLRWEGVGSDDISPLLAVFCQGSPQRRLIFDAWGEQGGWLSGRALLRLAASPTMEAGDRQALATAIPAWDKRYEAEMGNSFLSASPAMQKLSRGLPITAKDIAPLKPIRCPSGA